jgi:hypothetical protein
VPVDGLTDPTEIALKEFAMGKFPLTIERPLPSQRLSRPVYETRSFNDLLNVYELI